MTTPREKLEIAERILYLDGYYLDQQRWQEWLELYAQDVTYWVPLWKSEHEPTDSPDSEISLIYYVNRNGLQDRVLRATSGLSPASVPLLRTIHTTSNVLLPDAQQEGHIVVHSSWTTHLHNPVKRTTNVLFGRSEHLLRPVDGEWKIAKRKTFVYNDLINTVLDFYHI